MPLDGHSYLISQGWAGKGTGLRHGAISRPLAIPQKRTLAGLGKDRDEAFPFWDHLFSAAAKSIQLKVSSDSDSDSNKNDTPTGKPMLKRTTTGILSNRRPVTGTPASMSGTNTPETGDQAPRSSLLVIAKREAAKHGLYARFFRGAILGPECHNPDNCEAGAEPEDVNTRDNADLEFPDKESAKRARSRDGHDDDKRRRKKKKKDLKEKQKKGKVKKELVRRGKESIPEDEELRREMKRRRKREAEVDDELASEKMETKMEVQMVEDLSAERLEVSRDRKKRKQRRKNEDGEELKHTTI